MSILDSASRTTVNTDLGSNTVRLSGLTSGTMYAVFLKPLCGAQTGDTYVPATAGPGGALVDLTSLSASSQALLADFVTATGSGAYPAGCFVAGASSAYSSCVPQFSINTAASSDLVRVLRVAAPDFNSDTNEGISYIQVRVSRDAGSTYSEYYNLTTPFSGGLNYATVSVSVPYAEDVKVVAQAYFKDGTAGKTTRALTLVGAATPSTNTLTVPVIASVTGELAYSESTNSVGLSLTVVATPDPDATSMMVQVTNPATSAVVGSTYIAVDSANPTASLTATFDGISSNATSYTVTVASVIYGVNSELATATFAVPAASTYHPDPIVVSSITAVELISSTTTGLISQISFAWEATTSQPAAHIYLRRHDNFTGNAASFDGFTLAGTSTTHAYLTESLFAGATVSYDVLVLAVGVSGTEALFTADQIINVDVQQYANYQPLIQEVPTVTITGTDTATLAGSYTRPTGTPAPLAIRLYKSETDFTTANLVATVTPTANSTGTSYAWSYDIPSLAAIGSPALLAIKVYLESGTITADSYKTVLKFVMNPPAAVPVMRDVRTYVKTLGGSVTNCAATLSTVTAAYTATTGGNGTTFTITPPKNALSIEISDSGTTVGLNAENVTPSFDFAGNLGVFVAATSKCSGSKNVRARWASAYGLSDYSSAVEVTFADLTAADTTIPDVTACCPRYVCNSDGSITISWTAATFGTSGLGCYQIRRSKTNNVASSYTVGSMATTTTLSWTDGLATDMQGYTYYYWLEAVSGQGLSSTPSQVKLSSANTYAVETTVGAVSVDAVPSTITSIAATGAQGGFNVAWTASTDRDIKDYVLEFSALGTWADTVSVSVASNTYFQVLGASATSAVAAVYRWRVKARDYSAQVSAAYATSAAPDLTNYGSITDSAPTAPSAATLTANTDGSITITLTASSAPYFHIKRLRSAATWTPATSGTTDDTKVVGEFITSGTSTTYTDTGLTPGYYYAYQIYTRSKLGTDSTTFAAPATPVAVIYQVAGVQKANLISNGHFGNASGAYGTSTTGWTLNASASLSGSGAFTYNSTAFTTPKLVHTGATAAVVASQVIQVIPGQKYTVMGVISYNPITLDGNAYIRVASAGTLSSAANGSTTAPAPYSAATKETSGTDVTIVHQSYRFISYSFTAPAGVSTMTLNIGFENRTASDSVSIYPQFIQVYADA